MAEFRLGGGEIERNGKEDSGGLLGKGSFVVVVIVLVVVDAGVSDGEDTGDGGLSYSVTSGFVNFTLVCGVDEGLGI